MTTTEKKTNEGFDMKRAAALTALVSLFMLGYEQGQKDGNKQGEKK